MRHEAYRRGLVDAILNAPGEIPADVRRAVLERAKAGIPPRLAQYIDTVSRHAYRVTAQDVADLQQSGHSDDAIFEVTVASAVGAAMYRLERGMAALRGEEPD
jgi:alkylhydroperoxidase family enzyme